MNRLDELIAEMCPNGVVSIPMGSLMTRIRERKKDSIKITQVYAVSNTLGIVKAEDFRENTIHSDDTSNYTVIREGMVAYNPSRLNIGSIAMLNTCIPGLVSPMYVVFSIDESKVIREYFEYLMHSPSVINKINSFKEEGARFRFDFSRWNWILVQIPPIAVQKEIVRILNIFKKLITMLTAELTARRKQYEYYSEALLTFNGSIESFQIGDFCQLSAGGDVPKEAFSNVKTKEYLYPIISNGIGEKGLYGYTNSYKINKPCVTVAARGAGVGYVTYRDYPFFPIIRLVSVVPDKRVIPKYLYYVMKRIRFEPTQGGIPQLTAPMIAKYKVPIPPIEIQKRIVKVLDYFETICYSLNNGIPAEINLRNKQYEYYRNKLLLFKENCQ